MKGQKGEYRVYLNEFNLLMGDSTYLPLVSGILHAYARRSTLINDTYEFMPYHFHVDKADTIINSHDRPFVAAFSVSMWNEQLSLKVAEGVKRRFPDCTIIFGGAQVPHKPEAYFEKYSFIDVTVKGEGEDAFVGLLEALARGEALDSIPGVSWRNPQGEVVSCAEERLTSDKDLDLFPSPYLEGLYEELMASRPDLNFQAIIETNRGCPFKCTFCYWGMGGLRRKYRFHSLERVKAEIEWMAKHEIRYVFNADSNFGMHRRDEEIAQMLIDSKKQYGFPEKFRTCYGKNTDDRIFEIGCSLHENQLEKGITISYQSTDETVQKNIKRDNIKLSVAQELQRKFNERNVPVYTEMILGLPGETADSWRLGIDRILNAGLKNQLFLYICEVLPNTDLADPTYQRLHGIKSRPIELTEIHVTPRQEGWITEYEDIVVETADMPRSDWRQMLLFSWTTMLFHSLKLAFYIMAFLRREYGVSYSDIISSVSGGEFDPKDYPMLAAEVADMNRKVDAILEGEGRGVIARQYGEIYWEQEEVAFFNLAHDFPAFYAEFYRVIKAYLDKGGFDYDPDILAEVFKYQELRMPRYAAPRDTEYQFAYNIPEYFEYMFTSKEVPVSKGPQRLITTPIDFGGDVERYCREGILWKRKNGNFLTEANWSR